MDEIWKILPDFEDRYEVSNLGKIRSFRGVGRGSQKRVVSKILSTFINTTKGDYKAVNKVLN